MFIYEGDLFKENKICVSKLFKFCFDLSLKKKTYSIFMSLSILLGIVNFKI